MTKTLKPERSLLSPSSDRATVGAVSVVKLLVIDSMLDTLTCVGDAFSIFIFYLSGTFERQVEFTEHTSTGESCADVID